MEKEKKEKLRIKYNAETENDHLYSRLHDYFCLSAAQAQKIIDTYSQERIIKNLAYVEEKYKKGKVKHIGAYTNKAIEEDFNSQRSQFDLEQEKQELATGGDDPINTGKHHIHVGVKKDNKN